MVSKFASRMSKSLLEKSSVENWTKRWGQRWKQRKKPPTLIVLGAALLVSGGAIAFLNFRQRAPRVLAPVGMQMVPSTALGTVTLTTDELAWTKLRQFGTPDTQQQLDEFLKGWKQRLFTANGYSFKRDVKPWIGDRVTLAILPSQATSNQPGIGLEAQDFVLVVPIEDALKARNVLSQDAEKAKAVTAERTYKGITVQTVASTEGSTIEAASIGTNWILLGSTKAAIEQAIDTYKGAKSLLDVTGYRKAATKMEAPQPQGKNFAQVYVNIPAATQVFEPPEGIQTNRRGSILPLQGSEGLVAKVLIEPEGVRFEGTSWLLPKQDLVYENMSNEAGEMPRRLPGDTLVMMSGSNLAQFWQGFSEGNTSPPFFPDPQNLKAGLLTQTGLDIDTDIMPWAAGEFAIGLLPPQEADPASSQTPGQTPNSTTEQNPNSPGNSQEIEQVESAPLLVMVQTNDRKTAESVWAQLDEVMARRYRFAVEKREFEDGSLTEWISPFQGVQFSHGWLPGNMTFFTVGGGVSEEILAESGVGESAASGQSFGQAPSQSLAESRLFQTLTNEAPKPNNGNFYIDLAQINRLGNVFPLPQLSAEGATAAIEAVGLTSQVGDRTMDYDLYVKLAKAPKPEPL